MLHAVWAGPPDGIRSLTDLHSLNDREAFVAGHVQRVFAQELPPHLRERMPRRYLELEEQRLTRLVTEWLEYEATRIDFEVDGDRGQSAPSTSPVSRFDLRLDRIDRLNDGSLLVIDYKSGNVSPNAWELPRPDDVQLPLYAGFAPRRGRGAWRAGLRQGARRRSGICRPASSIPPRLSLPASRERTPW